MGRPSKYIKPIHKFNGGRGATLCNECRVIIREGLTDDLVFTDYGWVYHFNGIPDTSYGTKVEHYMNKTYNKLYKS